MIKNTVIFEDCKEKKCTELDLKEREIISFNLKNRRSVDEIAAMLGRSTKTIYREIDRGSVKNKTTHLKVIKVYNPNFAEITSRTKKMRRGRKNSTKDVGKKRFISAVKSLIKKGYSIYDAVQTIQDNKNGKYDSIIEYKVSVPTIYRLAKDGVININVGRYKVKNKRDKDYKNIPSGVQVDENYKHISDRPEEINNRLVIGHYEGDLIVSSRVDKTTGKKSGTTCLLTLVERVTRRGIIIKIPDKTQKSVREALQKIEEKLHEQGIKFKDIIRSITFDNGQEFRNPSTTYRSKYDDSKLLTVIYYCNSYASYERGSNERFNRQVRRFIPKGTDIGNYSDEFILELENFINNMHRKILNGDSANTRFNEYLKEEFQLEDISFH